MTATSSAPEKNGDVPALPLKFYADYDQARTVFDLLIDRLSKKGPPYNTAMVPQADQFLPVNLEKGSREHAIFLFSLCLWMRGGIESDTAARFLKAMHESHPAAFEPTCYSNTGAEETAQQIASVTDLLVEHQLGQRVEENAPGWVYNMRKLQRFWDSDPRRLMNDNPSFSTLVDRIISKTSDKNGNFAREDNPHGFRFFREKMVAMLAYFLIDAKLVPMFYTPVPVDFHVLRLLTSNGILRIQGMEMHETLGINFLRTDVLRLAREVTEWYCRENKVSPIALCDSLWLLSRSLCRNNPGNSGYVVNGRRKAATEEKRNKKAANGEHPEFEMEIVDGNASASPNIEDTDTEPELTGRKRYIGYKHTAESLARPSMVKRYNKSCGVCPVEAHCRFNISAGAYYVAGDLEAKRLRVKPPPHTQLQADFVSELGSDSLHRPPKAGHRFAEIKVRDKST